MSTKPLTQVDTTLKPRIPAHPKWRERVREREKTNPIIQIALFNTIPPMQPDRLPAVAPLPLPVAISSRLT